MRAACRWTAATLVWSALAAGACLAEGAAARDQGLAARDAREGEQTTSSSEPAAEDKVGKELHALRIGITSPPIRIDGRMDDDVWNRAEAISDFVQEDPDNMVPATERMTIRVAYDDRYVYVAVEMFMRDSSLIRDGLGRRGSAPPSDKIQIGFDTAHDHTNAYCFEANASGIQHDYLMVDDTRTNNDYEAVWEVGTLRSLQGWNSEFRIPFSQMRFPASSEVRTVWGFNVRREIFSRGESDWWVAKPRDAQGTVSRFGHLVFDDRLTPPRRLEVTPYTLGQFETKSGVGPGGSANGGVDVRVGLGTSANLSATVNPDFGQLEADPSVLNLSVFETFFPEKRPFFLEESQSIALSTYGQFPDFYSRRIGQTPDHFKLSDSQTLVRKPDQTTILGAAKLTGRTSRWTYGGLTALTSREYATVDDSDAANGATIVRRVQKLIEPRALYSVGRLQRNVLGDTSSIGIIATSVAREKDLDAATVGGDVTIRRDDNRFYWGTHWVATHAPIDGVMKNGMGGVINGSYTRKYAGMFVRADHFGPTFHNTDLGFLSSRTNKNEIGIAANLRQPDPHGFIRSSFFEFYGGRQWNNERLVFGKWAGVFTNFNFLNYWRIFFGAQRNFPTFDDLDTRGGPPIVRQPNTFLNVGIFSDSRKQYGYGVRANGHRDPVGGFAFSVEPEARVQLSPRLIASIGVEYTSAIDSAQWIKNTDTDGDGADDHVYGRLRRHVMNITGRATYSFTRDMTLEAYLQPFVAVGDYTNIGRLARARSFDFAPVTLADNPDFNKKSVRGTVVLRWEYIRGSTLFAVWNIATSDEAARPGAFSPLHDLRGAFGAPGTNVLAIKLSYWFAP
jgi:hypothetical protein